MDFSHNQNVRLQNENPGNLRIPKSLRNLHIRFLAIFYISTFKNLMSRKRSHFYNFNKMSLNRLPFFVPIFPHYYLYSFNAIFPRHSSISSSGIIPPSPEKCKVTQTKRNAKGVM